MEIESKNGSKIRLQEGSETFDFGRELGFISGDRAISRHHISFKLHEDRTRVYFEVKGKNPVWVRDSGNDEIRVYKRSEAGEIKNGDSFCVASKNPVWFNVKRIASEDEDDSESKSELSLGDAFAETSGIEYDEIDTGDISHIDPVKEFNFVVMGHEFDHYPKKMLRDIRNWDWFLEEPKEESDEEEASERKRKKGTGKRRKKSGGDDDDEVWTGESEEDVEMIKKMRSAPKPKYSTGSKEQKRNNKGASTSKSVMDATKKNAKNDYGGDDDDDEDEDEEDETLGGFIIDDEDIGQENDEDDEEEEFEADEEEDE